MIRGCGGWENNLLNEREVSFNDYYLTMAAVMSASVIYEGI